MTKPNRMMKIANAMAKLPEPLRTFAISKAFGTVVPMVGTAGLRYEQVTPNKVVVSIKNQRPMQNHIKGVHAAAMALLAETATGFVVGLNVPDDRLMLIKSLHVDYKKMSKGDMRATATLSDEQRQYIADNDKGEIIVPITVVDESGNSPIECTMNWAWLPKKKK
ncbi:DUF4442 domain-containing protein [Alkanindiges sp. WGS2144]|uniref:DUF4442 domain-containing protein n=1 Tax=Alkanindiges sp. WGS2144 TaxID=3366808 RepID=UPI003752DFEA